MNIDEIAGKTLAELWKHERVDDVLKVWGWKTKKKRGLEELINNAIGYIAMIKPRPSKTMLSMAASLCDFYFEHRFSSFERIDTHQYDPKKTSFIVANHYSHIDEIAIGYALVQLGANLDDGSFPSTIAGNNLFQKIEDGVMHTKRYREFLMKKLNATILHREFIDAEKLSKDSLDYNFTWNLFIKNMLIGRQSVLNFAGGSRMRPDYCGDFLPAAFNAPIDASGQQHILLMPVNISYETSPDMEELRHKGTRANGITMRQIMEYWQRNYGEFAITFGQPISIEPGTNPIELKRYAEKQVYSNFTIFPADVYCAALSLDGSMECKVGKALDSLSVKAPNFSRSLSQMKGDRKAIMEYGDAYLQRHFHMVDAIMEFNRLKMKLISKYQ